MVDRNLIIENFEELSLEIPSEVIDKCVELCEEYNLDENEMVETWMAHAMSNSEGISPSVDRLNMMARKGLLIKGSKPRDELRKAALNIYTRSSFHNEPELQEGNVPSPKVTPRRLPPKTYEEGMKELSKQVHSPRMLFSQDSYSPQLAEDSKTYSERINSGDVLCKFGENLETCTWSTNIHFHPTVNIADDFLPCDKNVKYMFATPLEKVLAIRRRADLVCLDIIKNHDIKLPKETNFITMDIVTYVGRIVCDGNGKLNASSVLLDTCLFDRRSTEVLLDVAKIPEYSLFPGQVVAIEGTNPTGTKIIAEKIYTDVKLSMYPPLKENINLKEPLQIIVAVGPYTLTNSFCYQPLTDLQKYVVKYKPHALILIGPFVDSKQPGIDQSTSSFADFYTSLVSTMLSPFKEIHTKLILCSSWREASSHMIYPTPPTPVKFENPALVSLPDPCIIDIAGFSLGITSVDVLMHLGKEELFRTSSGINSQRLPRLASHLYQQSYFYPLHPGIEGMSIDTILLADYARIPRKPHVLILPSDMKCFIKEVNGSIVINPEKLTKGLVGGNFARIEVKPAVEGESWSPATHVSAQIVKI